MYTIWTHGIKARDAQKYVVAATRRFKRNDDTASYFAASFIRGYICPQRTKMGGNGGGE